MTGNSHPCYPAIALFLPAKRMFWPSLYGTLAGVTAFTATAMHCAAATPVIADSHVYRIVNGYNSEMRGQASYCVERSDAGRVVVAVTTNRDGAQSAATEIYTPDGNWLRHVLTNHDQPVEYEFSPAYPAYDFPLVAGKQWSTRISAVNPATGARRSVRVDAAVRGSERIRVPAGEFDTIKINRSIYAGDEEFPHTETTIIETEWYAPSLGRSVRVATRSNWLNLSKRFPAMDGDWNIYELMAAPAPKPGGC
jgi:hypothetical protein